MNPCLIQQFLRGNPDGLQELENDFKLKIKTHAKFPELHHFSYDQIESPMKEPICQEARGLILDRYDNWKIVARPFGKFFNVSEPLAHKLDWNRARVFEKVDGSLCVLYFYKNTWHVATTGTPDAGGEVNGFDFTFEDLFWITYHTNATAHFNGNPAFTYMFELTSPYNQVVVRHSEPKLTLLAIRHKESGLEMDINGLSIFGIQAAKSFDLNNLDEINEFVKNIDPFKQEGVVAFDGVRRLKIKSDKYVEYHHLRSSFNPKNAVNLILMNEIDEFVSYFPEFTNVIAELQAKVNDFCQKTNDFYNKIKDLGTQKEFALEAVKNSNSSVLFFMRKNPNLGPLDYLREQHESKRLEIVEAGNPKVSARRREVDVVG